MEQQRFPPGTLIASRYRVISRLGKGGMGEVFRADDLILGQPVALKFLPEQATGNVNLLTRFYEEVRIARQVTHANVCRVYDIGEVQGQPYLSMEYMDGEDLGSLLRRIGRLPADKATEFSRKICAGLAAAHAQGVLHRDLKPANVMIDARGQVRIMDFGLAALGEHLQGAEVRNGTPAYMAPEQLTGKEVSVQSDIYALGLVMYEMYTGKAPFEAETAAEILHLREQSKVSHPSTLIHDMDPAVERAILQCLEPDPRKRPASALELAASLTGGDALSAALAAGETPSPQLVAAAGTKESVKPAIAIPVLAAIFVSLAALYLTLPRLHVPSHMSMENPPEVLTAKARELIHKLGYTDRPVDWASGYASLNGYLEYRQEKKVASQAEWDRVLAGRPSPATFWYRQSPRLLEPWSIYDNARVDLTDPFPSVSGMSDVLLDPDGHLLAFHSLPPQFDQTPPGATADFAPLLAAADLDTTKLKPADPQWTPLFPIDQHAAWTGMLPSSGDLPIRVEAAAWRGKPVYFEVIFPWHKPFRMEAEVESTASRAGNLLNNLLFLAIVIGAGVMAWHNWRTGRGDLRGATHLGVVILTLKMLVWACGAHHVASKAEQSLFNEALADALIYSVVMWGLYLALEPWVRRYWPQTLITWSRVMDRRFNDPLVGRDLMLGVLFGMGYCLVIAGYEAAAVHFGDAPSTDFSYSNLLGGRWVAWKILAVLLSALTSGPAFFFAIFLLRALLRKLWLAGAAFVAIYSAIRILNVGFNWLNLGFWVVIYSVIVVILIRFGLFATVITLFVIDTLIQTLLTTDFAAWYGTSSLLLLVVISGLALYGFKTALGGRSLVADAPQT
jgi:serine/threonine-protein kinase